MTYVPDEVRYKPLGDSSMGTQAAKCCKVCRVKKTAKEFPVGRAVCLECIEERRGLAREITAARMEFYRAVRDERDAMICERFVSSGQPINEIGERFGLSYGAARVAVDKYYGKRTKTHHRSTTGKGRRNNKRQL